MTSRGIYLCLIRTPSFCSLSTVPGIGSRNLEKDLEDFRDMEQILDRLSHLYHLLTR